MRTGGTRGDPKGVETARNEMEKKSANHQAPVDFFEEFPLQDVELRYRYTADLGVEAVGAEGVAETLTRDCDGRDDEAMASERGEREQGHPGTDLIDVVQGDEETRLLFGG